MRLAFVSMSLLVTVVTGRALAEPFVVPYARPAAIPAPPVPADHSGETQDGLADGTWMRVGHGFVERWAPLGSGLPAWHVVTGDFDGLGSFVDGDRVVAAQSDGNPDDGAFVVFRGLSLDDGREAWKHRQRGAYASMRALSGGVLLYSYVDYDHVATLVGHDGKVLWSTAVKARDIVIRGGRLTVAGPYVVIASDLEITLIDAATGVAKVQSVAFHDHLGSVFGGDGFFIATTDPDDYAHEGLERWDIANGVATKTWRSRIRLRAGIDAVAGDVYLYQTPGRVLHAVDLASGKERWAWSPAGMCNIITEGVSVGQVLARCDGSDDVIIDVKSRPPAASEVLVTGRFRVTCRNEESPPVAPWLGDMRLKVDKGKFEAKVRRSGTVFVGQRQYGTHVPADVAVFHVGVIDVDLCNF